MARKKRKSAPAVAPAPSAAAQSAGAGGIPLPALGALALLCAWLALLGGVSDLTLDQGIIFHLDPMRLPLMFNDWADGKFPLSGWNLGAMGVVLPEFLSTWPLFFVGLDHRIVHYLYPLLQFAVAALGWIVLCDALFGKSPARRTAVLLLHVLLFLHLAWRGEDLFLTLIVAQSHGSAWTPMPWLLWLSLRALDSDEGDGPRKTGRPLRLGWLAALAALTAVAAADAVILPWFVAPAAFAALSLACRGGVSWRAAAALTAALVAGYWGGRQLVHLANPHPQADMSFRLQEVKPEAVLESAREMLNWAEFLVPRNPLESAVWLAFAVVAGWRALAVLRPALQRGMPPFMELPPGRTHAFLALFVPVSAVASAAAMIAAGYFWFSSHGYGKGLQPLSFAHRNMLPFILFPLFIGWILLPWRVVALSRLRPGLLPAACCAAALLLATPKVFAIRTDALDPLASPFHQCFAENARRLGWTGGIGMSSFGQKLTLDPDAGVERMLDVIAFRAEDGLLPANPHPAGQGRSLLLIAGTSGNVHEFGGEFQFAVANVFRGRIFHRVPRTADKGCPLSDFHGKCGVLGFTEVALDDETFRQAFGEPKEVIECAGIGLLHYDPPLQFDLAGRRGGIVAHW